MNKLLDLYDEYLRRGENIYLLMLKVSNNNFTNVKYTKKFKNEKFAK